MVASYDPLADPDAAEWLELSEDERIQLIEQFHRRARVRLPNRRLHATMHAIVETQVATGDAIPVRETLERLQTEGLDRQQQARNPSAPAGERERWADRAGNSEAL